MKHLFLAAVALAALSAISCNKGDDPIIKPDLSASETANCYIVNKAGSYRFKTVKGNSDESVGAVDGAETLWETFGSDDVPKEGDLVKDVSYEDGYIKFTYTGKKGNAVIAAKSGKKILWSWHIWCCGGSMPKSQAYNNGAGTLMDRNLGATTSSPDELGSLGLLYQWGRKDPFLNVRKFGSENSAVSTLPDYEWRRLFPSQALKNNTTLAYSIENPTCLFMKGNFPYDWYCDEKIYKNDNLWSSKKTIYDPCPPGWRVPDGGKKEDGGVWAKAFDDNAYLKQLPQNDWTYGIDFSKFTPPLGPGPNIYYPAAGANTTSVGEYGYYWSCTSMDVDKYDSEAYIFYFNIKSNNCPVFETRRQVAASVRCMAE